MKFIFESSGPHGMTSIYFVPFKGSSDKRLLWEDRMDNPSHICKALSSMIGAFNKLNTPADRNSFIHAAKNLLNR